MTLWTPRSKVSPYGGGYRISATSGDLTTVAANGPVWSFRWTDTTRRALIQNVVIRYAYNTAFGAAQLFGLGLYVARAFTVADTGGTAQTLTTNNGKLDTDFPVTSLVAGSIRIGTTGVITAGTRTLDAQPIATRMDWLTTTLQNGSYDEDWRFGYTDSSNPITLHANEGLVLNNLILMGATGTVRLWVDVEWSCPGNGVV
jgi:hypothetical protein